MEKSARLVRNFLNSRARVVHLGGHSVVAAWLYDVDMPFGWISCDSPLAIDESIALVLQGNRESAQVRARVLDIDRHEMRNREKPVTLERGVTIPLPLQYCYRVEFTTPIRPTINRETDRKAVLDKIAKLGSLRFERKVLLADVSASGARVLTTTPIEIGELLSFEFERDGKTVAFSATGRYARKVASPRELYSVGLQFEDIGRIDAARWKVVLDEAGSIPARSSSAGESILTLAQASESGKDFRNIANKLLEKIEEVDKAEREFLRNQLSNEFAALETAELVALEIQLDVMAQHKRQYIANLASAIEILYTQAQSTEQLKDACALEYPIAQA